MADAPAVLPTYNEVDNLKSIVGRIPQSVSDTDVPVVDDAGPDETGGLSDRVTRTAPYLIAP